MSAEILTGDGEAVRLLPYPLRAAILAEVTPGRSLCRRAIATADGLFGYLVKAAHDSGRLGLEPRIVTSAFVRVAAVAIRWTVRGIRKKHIASEDRCSGNSPSR